MKDIENQGKSMSKGSKVNKMSLVGMGESRPVGNNTG